MKLYYSQFTRAGRARWMLEEVGASYELERISFASGAHKSPEYLALHPHGVVPTLVDGDLTLFESSAIVMHLADKFPDKKLAPPLGSSDRAHYYRWMVYVPATADPVLETLTQHTRLLPEERRLAAVAETARRRVEKVAKVMDVSIDGRAFVVGDSFTAADVVVASCAGWLGFLGMLGDFPHLASYHQRMSERPAYARAYSD